MNEVDQLDDSQGVDNAPAQKGIVRAEVEALCRKFPLYPET